MTIMSIFLVVLTASQQSASCRVWTEGRVEPPTAVAVPRATTALVAIRVSIHRSFSHFTSPVSTPFCPSWLVVFVSACCFVYLKKGTFVDDLSLCVVFINNHFCFHLQLSVADRARTVDGAYIPTGVSVSRGSNRHSVKRKYFRPPSSEALVANS